MRLGRLLQTAFWRARVRVAVSRPLHAPGGHLQPSTGLFKDDQVTFRWRDTAHNNQQKPMTLSVDEFLRRFLLHLLPRGFVRIRHSSSLPIAVGLGFCRYASQHSGLSRVAS